MIENPKTHFFTRYAFNEWLKPIFLVNTITKQYDKTIYSITITVFLLKTVSLFYWQRVFALKNTCQTPYFVRIRQYNS